MAYEAEIDPELTFADEKKDDDAKAGRNGDDGQKGGKEGKDGKGKGL